MSDYDDPKTPWDEVSEMELTQHYWEIYAELLNTRHNLEILERINERYGKVGLPATVESPSTYVHRNFDPISNPLHLDIVKERERIRYYEVMTEAMDPQSPRHDFGPTWAGLSEEEREYVLRAIQKTIDINKVEIVKNRAYADAAHESGTITHDEGAYLQSAIQQSLQYVGFFQALYAAFMEDNEINPPRESEE